MFISIHLIQIQSIGIFMNELTERQLHVLCTISDYIAEHGQSPSVAEIGRDERVSDNAAHEHVSALIKKGYITKRDGVSRGIFLTDTGKHETGDHFVIPVSYDLYVRIKEAAEIAEVSIEEYIDRQMFKLAHK